MDLSSYNKSHLSLTYLAKLPVCINLINRFLKLFKKTLYDD